MTDNAVLHISYNNGRGHMTVNTLAFLSEQGIRNIRKLIKLIESSDTPDELEKLHSILREEISTFDLRLKELANRGANARTRYKELEPELERLVYQRERYKKSDQRYKDLMLRVKAARENIRHEKAVYHSAVSDFKRLSRNKEKFNKIAKEILP